MYKNILLLFFVFGLAVVAHANHANSSLPDSITQVVEGLFWEDSKINYLLGIVQKEQYRNPDLAKAVAQEAYFRANSEGDKALKAEATFWIGWLEFQHNKDGYYADAMSIANISTNLYRDLGDVSGLSRSLSLKAALTYDSGDTTLAKKYIDEAETLIPKITHKYRDSIWILGYLNLIKSNIYTEQRLNLQEQSLRLFEQTGDSIRIGRICFKLAGAVMDSMKSDLAIQYLHRAADAFKSAQYGDGERLAYIRYIDVITRVYASNPTPEMFNRVKSSILIDPVNIQKDHELLARMGYLYTQGSFFSKSDDKKRMMSDSALFYLNKAWKLLKETQNIDELTVVYNNKLFNCEVLKNCEGFLRADAATFLELLKISTTKTLKTQNTLTETYNKDRQRSLDEERTRQYYTIEGAILVLIIMAFAFAYFNQQRNIHAMHRELNNRMEALRAQMNPHFISNALNAIESLVNQNRNKEASHYIIQFSRLCRVILNNSRSESVTLGEELDMLKYFMNLEQLRMGDRLQYKMEIDAALNKDEIALPPMILQPFVENSIWHGIVPKTGGGTVLVKAIKINDSFYQCVVEDDGIGRKKAEENKARMVINRPSLGLAITEERIEKLYKLKGSQIATEDLHHNDGSPAGTRVTITLPIQSITHQK